MQPRIVGEVLGSWEVMYKTQLQSTVLIQTWTIDALSPRLVSISGRAKLCTPPTLLASPWR